MFFYAIVFLLFFSLLMFSRQRAGKDVIYWAAVLMLALVSAIRFDVGTDFAQFYEMEVPPIGQFSWFPTGRGFDRFGVSVKLLYILSDFLGCRQLIFAVTSFITYGLFGWVIRRYSVDAVCSWSVFVGFFLIPSYNIIWQMTAMAFVVCSLPFVVQRKPLGFILFVCLAMTFHASALVAIVVYPLYNYARSYYVIIGGCVLLAIISAMLAFMSQISLYADYVETLDEYTGGQKLRFLYPVLVMGLLALSKKRSKETVNLCGLFPVVLAGVFPPFYFGAAIGGRIGLYFMAFLVILTPYSMRGFRVLMQFMCFALIAFFFFSVELCDRSDTLANTYVPYRCFMFTDTSLLVEREK